MKKLLFIFSFISLFTLCGCNQNLNNTPTKQAEIFLGKYQTLHKDVLTDLDKITAEEENFTGDQRDTYKSIMKRHYQDLQYEIKEESIDGDKATVTVQIEVRDYSKSLIEADNKLLESPEEFSDESGMYDNTKYNEYKLNLLKNTKDKVKYTLELTFTKKDKKWVIDDLSKENMEKINGTYKY